MPETPNHYLKKGVRVLRLEMEKSKPPQRAVLVYPELIERIEF